MLVSVCPLVSVHLSRFCLPDSVALFTYAVCVYVCVYVCCLSVAASRSPWGTQKDFCYSKSRTQFSSELWALSTKSFVTFVIRKANQHRSPHRHEGGLGPCSLVTEL